jgi:hypothetical protein
VAEIPLEVSCFDVFDEPDVCAGPAVSARAVGEAEVVVSCVVWSGSEGVVDLATPRSRVEDAEVDNCADGDVTVDADADVASVVLGGVGTD